MTVQASRNPNVADAIRELAQTEPDRVALYLQGDRRGLSFREVRYADLEEECQIAANRLTGAGVGTGTRVVLMVPPSRSFFVLTFALFRIGAVPVFVDPGMGLRALKQCLGQVEPEVFIGVPKAHLARKLFGWANQTLNQRLVVGAESGFDRLWGRPWRTLVEPSTPAARYRAQPDDLAAILFTSGSTGPPKGAIYTHGMFRAQVDAIRDAYKIEPGEVDLSTFPLFALFGPALGMSCVVPPMDFTRPGRVDPELLVALIERFQVTNFFGSPAVLARLARIASEHQPGLSSLRRIISAGAPADPEVVATVSHALSSGVEVHTPYGATEALPVSTIGSDEVGNLRAQTEAGRGVCVGRPLAGIEVEVIEITDRPIETWNSARVLAPQTQSGFDSSLIGEIVVRGPVVSPAYFARSTMTQLAKIDHDGRVVHRMGDLGYFDAQGRLWFCGRKSHRVETQARRYTTVAAERVFNQHPEVARTALVGIDSASSTPAQPEVEPALFVEPTIRLSARQKRRIASELFELGQQSAASVGIATFYFVPSFPVDIRHNSKIFREKLTSRAPRIRPIRIESRSAATGGEPSPEEKCHASR